MPKLPQAILIHGWDPKYYNKNIPGPIMADIAWSHRPELIKLLAKRFSLKYFNLPGFCGMPEPDKLYFEVEDFADYFAKWRRVNTSNAKLIIAYSFGGPVALTQKVQDHDPTPLILISPALRRGETLRSRVASVAKTIIPKVLTSYLKNYYQKMASDYYRQGTPFLRSTYDVVVRQDMSYLLAKVDPTSTFLIYGDQDQDTPWSQVKEGVIKNDLSYRIIKNGRHNIGQTHPEEIVETIKNFLKKKKF